MAIFLPASALCQGRDVRNLPSMPSLPSGDESEVAGIVDPDRPLNEAGLASGLKGYQEREDVNKGTETPKPNRNKINYQQTGVRMDNRMESKNFQARAIRSDGKADSDSSFSADENGAVPRTSPARKWKTKTAGTR